MPRLILALACLLCTPFAHAQTTGFYVPVQDPSGSLTAGFAYAQDAALSPLDASIGLAGTYLGDLRRDAVTARPAFATTDRIGPFFARYDASDDFQMGGGSSFNATGSGEGVAFDASGNLYTVGWIDTPSQTFFGANNTSGTIANTTGQDGYLISYNPANEVRYVTRVENIFGGDTRLYDIAVSANGQAWVGGRAPVPGASTGGFLASYDVATGTATANTAGGSLQSFLSSTGMVSVESVDVDAVGNAFFAGWFTGSLTVPGSTGSPLVSAGGGDMFVGYISQIGAVQWISRVGGAGADIGYAVTYDGNGILYLGGYVNGAVTIEHDDNPAFSSSLTGPNPGDSGVVLSFNASTGEPFQGPSWTLASLGGSRVWELSTDGTLLGIGGDFNGATVTMQNAYNGTAVANGVLTHTSDATGLDALVFFADKISGAVANAYSIANDTDDDRTMGIGMGGGKAVVAGRTGALTQSAIRLYDQSGTQLQSITRFNGNAGSTDQDAFVFTFSGASLPVELTSFEGALDGSSARLNWTTASETNNSGFSVEHDAGTGAGWTDAGWVGGAGTTLEAQSYTFRTQALAAGTHRFRLRQIDLDGAFEHSSVVELTVAGRGGVSLRVAPNPATDASTVRVSMATSQFVRVALYDALGREVSVLFAGDVEAGEAVESPAAPRPQRRDLSGADRGRGGDSDAACGRAALIARRTYFVQRARFQSEACPRSFRHTHTPS